ncbi:MAG: hypothetical protein HFH46_01795 [Bacilli bacterium]|nr:hypothetical protein [Bacilli bacterium]
MKRDQKRIRNKRIKTTLLVICTVFIVTLYAVFAQPLAYNMAIKIVHKITDIVKPGDNNSDSDDKDNISNNTENKDNGSKDNSNGGIFGNIEPSNPNNNAKWNISFTKVIKTEVRGSAKEISRVSYNDLSASFNVLLPKPSDSISYEFTISNKGTLDAKLDTISVTPENQETDAILYETSGVKVGDVLNAGESTTLIVTVSYNPKNEDIEPEGKAAKIYINYSQK